ncbi:VC0807 family protein, partial [Stutzerimonas xanthomarina]|uniref:VC0807 family protein n=1 Tax=Stutzerimonas xanthomarina TaxID=271420 RepID=UPI003AA7E0FC
GIIGVAVLASTRTRFPLIRTLLYNPKVLNVDKVHEQLERNGQTAHFETRLLRATYFLSVTFFFSSFMNYVLAKWIVNSPAGSEAFNAELGRMTLLSYPMIAIPSMVMMMAIFSLRRTIHGLTGLIEDIMATSAQEPRSNKAAHERPAGLRRPACCPARQNSLNIPITTIRPMMKMMPAVPPMNFNMPCSVSGLIFVTPCPEPFVNCSGALVAD